MLVPAQHPSRLAARCLLLRIFSPHGFLRLKHSFHKVQSQWLVNREMVSGDQPCFLLSHFRVGQKFIHCLVILHLSLVVVVKEWALEVLRSG